MNSQLNAKIQKKLLLWGKPLYSANEVRSMIASYLHLNDLASYKHFVSTKIKRSNQGYLIRYSRCAPMYGKCRLQFTDKIRKWRHSLWDSVLGRFYFVPANRLPNLTVPKNCDVIYGFLQSIALETTFPGFLSASRAGAAVVHLN